MDVQTVIGEARDAMTVKRVFGDPFEKNGVTVIPAANVRGGAGGGGGGGARRRARGRQRLWSCRQARRRLRDPRRRREVAALRRRQSDRAGVTARRGRRAAHRAFGHPRSSWRKV